MEDIDRYVDIAAVLQGLELSDQSRRAVGSNLILLLRLSADFVDVEFDNRIESLPVFRL